MRISRCQFVRVTGQPVRGLNPGAVIHAPTAQRLEFAQMLVGGNLCRQCRKKRDFKQRSRR
jgi:hypothetical protein